MISFVFFDVGGVALLDYSASNKWAEMKYDLGLRGNNLGIFDQIWKKHEYEYCIDFDVDRLIPIIEKECGIKLPKNYSMLQDFVDRFEANRSIWPVVEKIRKKYRIGLLTDQFPRMFDAIVKQKILPPVKWDVIIDSTKVGHQKPERQIFEIAEKRSHAKKSEILFIDNNPDNVAGAKDFGWQTFFYDSTDLVGSSQRLSELF